jgi:tRNA pseudouridine38-40 synthase
LSSSEPTLGATQRWRLDIAYDGAAFSGFAYQPEFTTVVGELRATLANTLGLEHEPVIVGAGRTDTGVHALHQVVHVDLAKDLAHTSRVLEPERLARSLNQQLRGRIRVLRVAQVSDDFHARFSAIWREYRYLVLETPPPALELTNAWSWAVQGPLDLDAMNKVTNEILGTHDFRAFCRRPTNSEPGEALRREVLLAQWQRLEDQWSLSPEGASVVRLRIRARSFCHNMVRCLVSTIVGIGQGRLSETTVRERLESLDRSHLPAPAPAAGLSLVAVGYDGDQNLPTGPQIL